MTTHPRRTNLILSGGTIVEGMDGDASVAIVSFPLKAGLVAKKRQKGCRATSDFSNDQTSHGG